MRIRTLKPEFWANEGLAKLSEGALLLAIALLNYSDDEGYFRANPALIKSFIFPLREPSTTIRRMLDDLSRAGYLQLCKGPDGFDYGKIVNFLKHQKIDKPSPSKIKHLCNFAESSSNGSRKVADDSALEQGTGNREQGNREQGSRDGEKVPTPEIIYGVYPKKVGKDDALKSIKKACDRIDPKKLLSLTLDYAAAIAKWPKDDYQFIPNPSTWFNQGRYADDQSAWVRKTNPLTAAEQKRLALDTMHNDTGTADKPAF